jgi:hypothetical protein
MAERMGDGLVRMGAMQPNQLEQVLAAQKAGDSRRFGEIALALGFVTEAAIKAWEASKGG